MEGGVAILSEQLLLHNLHDHVTCLSAALWISIDGDCLCTYRATYSSAWTCIHLILKISQHYNIMYKWYNANKAS